VTAAPDGTVGIIGLGRMGSAIAERLVGAGHDIIGYDSGSHIPPPSGVRLARSAEYVATSAAVVLLSLPDAEASAAVCARLARAERPRVNTIVDLSTIGIDAARGCATTLASAGLHYVDAPVSGGVAGAGSGSLTMMIACASELLDALTPVLGVVASRRFHVGLEAGAGQAMKLANNFVSAAAMAATSEAVVFAQRAGLEPAVVVDVLNASSGRTTASSDKFPKAVLTGSYDFGFTGALMSKDVRLYVEAAEAEGAPASLARAAAQLWADFDTACPGADFTYLHGYLDGAAAEASYG
jgi:3-hydroxyisobutyrate dehydrogenase-like beta-hydroxyacid dehydrogenase